MAKISKLFFSSFLILILSGCLQNPKDQSAIENNTKANDVVTNQDIPDWDYRVRFPNCDWRSRERSIDFAPSEVFIYSDEEHGIALEIPFNPKWSVTECPPVPPFEKNENGIVFGPVGPWDNRVYGLNIKPQLSLEETMKAISQNNSEEFTFKKHELTGASMLEYFPSSPGKCPDSSLIVFGEKNNFELYGVCAFAQGGIENDPIVKSIRLLPN